MSQIKAIKFYFKNNECYFYYFLFSHRYFVIIDDDSRISHNTYALTKNESAFCTVTNSTVFLETVELKIMQLIIKRMLSLKSIHKSMHSEMKLKANSTFNPTPSFLAVRRTRENGHSRSTFN